MAAAGYVNLKQVDRSLLVELKDGAIAEVEEVPAQPPAVVAEAATASASSPSPAVVSFPSQSAPSAAQVEEGVRALFDVFQNAKNPPHWPMYLRNVKQYVKNAAPSYDERRYGFVNFLEAVRAAGRSGLFRLERNRQGILRIFAGNQFPRPLPVPVFDIENELTSQPEVAEAVAVPDEPMPMPEEASPVLLEELPVEEVAVADEEPKAITSRRRPRPAASLRKKSTTARKTKKKSGTDSEPV
jgi:hypothetical protein